MFQFHPSLSLSLQNPQIVFIAESSNLIIKKSYYNSKPVIIVKFTTWYENIEHLPNGAKTLQNLPNDTTILEISYP